MRKHRLPSENKPSKDIKICKNIHAVSVLAFRFHFRSNFKYKLQLKKNLHVLSVYIIIYFNKTIAILSDMGRSTPKLITCKFEFPN